VPYYFQILYVGDVYFHTLIKTLSSLNRYKTLTEQKNSLKTGFVKEKCTEKTFTHKKTKFWIFGNFAVFLSLAENIG
jgi:hypothetical protein